MTYLEVPISIIASILIFSGQLTYFIGTWKKKIQPSILSWYGWALLMITLLVAQIVSVGWESSLTSILVCTIGCTAIGTAALIKKNYMIDRRDWWFLILGLICVVLYLLSNDPWLTTIYAVLADLIIGLPTIFKAIKQPLSEKSPAWIISVITWSLTLMISFNHDFLYALFPIYLWLYCVLLVYLLYFRRSGSVPSLKKEF